MGYGGAGGDVQLTTINGYSSGYCATSNATVSRVMSYPPTTKLTYASVNMSGTAVAALSGAYYTISRGSVNNPVTGTMTSAMEVSTAITTVFSKTELRTSAWTFHTSTQLTLTVGAISISGNTITIITEAQRPVRYVG